MSFEANFEDNDFSPQQEQAAAQKGGANRLPPPRRQMGVKSPSPTPSNQSRQSDVSRGSARGGGQGGRGRGPPRGGGSGGRGRSPRGGGGRVRGRSQPPGGRGRGGPPPTGNRPRSQSRDGASSPPGSMAASADAFAGAAGPNAHRARQRQSTTSGNGGGGGPNGNGGSGRGSPPSRGRGGRGGPPSDSSGGSGPNVPGRIPPPPGRGNGGGGSGRGPPRGGGGGRGRSQQGQRGSGRGRSARGGGGSGRGRGPPPGGRGGRGRSQQGPRGSPPQQPRGSGAGGPSFGPGRGQAPVILNAPPPARHVANRGDAGHSIGTLDTGEGSYRPLFAGNANRRGTGDWGRLSVRGDGMLLAPGEGNDTIDGVDAGAPLVDPSRLYIICEIALPKPEDEAAQGSNQRNSGANQGGMGGSGGGRGGAAGVGEAGAPYVSRSEARRRRDLLLETWDSVREYLRTHPSERDRRTAATYLGMFGMTPLHVVCKLPDPPPDVVEGMISCAPDALGWADSNGWLPLHHACANGACGSVLGLLCESHPEGRVAQDRRMRTPLHFAFFRSDVRSEHEGRGLNDGLLDGGGGVGHAGGSSTLADTLEGNHDEEENEAAENREAAAQDGTDGGENADGSIQRRLVGNSMPDIVSLLSEGGAATLRDENGMLPLHYACAYGTSTGVLRVLLDRHPPSLAARENKGRTPMHLAMVNAHRGASPGVLRYMLGRTRSAHVVNMIDAEGHLPLHLLANVTHRLRAEQKDAQRNATDCLRLYLSARPKATADFLTAIQALPEWLRDDAVVNPHVQEVLNDKIARRFPTSILMLDGYVLLIIIVCFEVASIYHIDSRFDPSSVEAGLLTNINGCVVLVLMGGAYFLIREAVQVISMIHLGTFRSWLFDLTNWLDVILIALVSYFGAAMLNTSIGSDAVFRNGCAITKGVLWISFINFVKSTLIDFAVFVGGVYYVLRRLLAFMVSLIVILLAFAQMFYIVYTKTELCETETDPETGEVTYPNQEGQYCFGDFPHCRFEISILKVYTMMMGEIGDECRYSTSPVAQALYVTYAFVVVIILSNVLIAIVTDSYGVIKNERAAMVFWSNRLDFVTEMDAILSVRRAFFGGIDKDTLDDKRQLGETTGRESAGLGPRDMAGGESNADAMSVGMSTHAHRYDGYQRDRSGVMYNGWGALMSLFETDLSKDMDISPGTVEFWLYIGVRFLALTVVVPAWVLLGIATAGHLWPPQVREWLFVQRKTAQTRSDMSEDARREIQKLRRGLRALKLELRGEKRSDRRELSTMRDEVEGVQKEVTTDLAQVKEIMGTLLELGREQQQQQQTGGVQ